MAFAFATQPAFGLVSSTALLAPPLNWVVSFLLVLFAIGAGLQLIAFFSRSSRSQAKTPRSLRREARRALAREDHGLAAELFAEAGDLEEAIAEYEVASGWEPAARLRARLGHHRKAAALFEQARLFEEAAEQHRRAGDLRRAEAAFGLAHRRIRAAQMYEEEGEHEQARRVYEALGKLGKAAEMCERLGLPGEAAAHYAEVYQVHKLRRRKRRGGKDDLEALAERIIALYAEAEDFDGQLGFLRKVGRTEHAAELAVRLGRTDEAVELFVEAGREDRAALVLETTGQVVQAARLRGDLAFRNQELHSAARHYESAGEVRLTAQVYVQLGDYARAASTYERAGDPGQAAYFYARLGEFGKAAALYDQAGNVDAAVRCYESSGELERCAELLERAGRHFEAGQKYSKLARFDEAIRCLQQVPKTSPSASAALALLGVAFFERGETRLARNKLEEAVKTGGVGAPAAPSAEVHYALGRIYEACGELDRARDEYEHVLALNFTFRDASDRLTAVSEALAPSEPPPPDATEMHEKTPPASALVSEYELDTDHGLRRSAAASGIPAGGVTETQDGGLREVLADPKRPLIPGSDRYEILEELGRGGMGVVYKCHDKLLDRLVAYKILSSQIREIPSAYHSFVREAKSAARLNHPNIVTLYDLGEANEGLFMTLEYVAGRNLRQFVYKERPRPEVMRDVLTGICNGLHYAHSQSVVHRDIKPSNVLVSSLDLKAKILDFGLAKIIERSAQTASGVLGTPWYMSPEQVLGTTTDYRTDLYSLGVTLFELFTGQLPFKGRDFGYHHVHTQPPRAVETNPLLAEDFGAVIDRCLEKAPEDRFQSANEIRKVIRSIDLYEDGLFDELQRRQRETAEAG